MPDPSGAVVHRSYLEVDPGSVEECREVLAGIEAERGQPLAIPATRIGTDQPVLILRRAWSGRSSGCRCSRKKPTQNAQVGNYMDGCGERVLAVGWFQSLFDTRHKIVTWRNEYNEERPHSSLGYKTPSEFCAHH